MYIPFLDLVTPHVEMEEDWLSLFGSAPFGGFHRGEAGSRLRKCVCTFCERHFVSVWEAGQTLYVSLSWQPESLLERLF